MMLLRKISNDLAIFSRFSAAEVRKDYFQKNKIAVFKDSEYSTILKTPKLVLIQINTSSIKMSATRFDQFLTSNI